MSTSVRYESLLVTKSDGTKCFFSTFSPSLNIIYGKNTSGKSTTLLSILYCLGINDVAEGLSGILGLRVIFRLSVVVTKNGKERRLTFIRDNSFLYLIEDSKPIVKFSGISSDNSAEHIKLKAVVSEIVDSSLTLLSSGEYKTAPIEALLLPYYISQAVGWVYLRKSFGSLDFIKNFKEDYLDFYLGVDNSTDRQRRIQLEAELELIKTKINLTSRIVNESSDIQLAKIVDESVPAEIPQYVQKFSDSSTEIARLERDLSVRTNELAFYTERKRVLFLINQNSKHAHETAATCPACNQALPQSIESIYSNSQDENDTALQIEECKRIIEEKQSAVNQIHKKIISLRKNNLERYQVLRQRDDSKVDLDAWIEVRANLKIESKVNQEIGEMTANQAVLQSEIKKIRSNEELQLTRFQRANEFKVLFMELLASISVTVPDEPRYRDIYSISSFPSQGVELHKTVMAYHLAFYRMTKGAVVHRFPFILDAVFKEDIDTQSKSAILTFLGKWLDYREQTFITFADSSESEKQVEVYNQNYFNGRGKLVCIGNARDERAFLSDMTDELLELHQKTIRIINEN